MLQRKSDTGGNRKKRPPRRSANSKVVKIALDVDDNLGDLSTLETPNYDYLSASDYDRSFETTIMKSLESSLADFKDDFLHEFSAAVDSAFSFDNVIYRFYNELSTEIETLFTETTEEGQNASRPVDYAIQTVSKQLDLLQLPKQEQTVEEKTECNPGQIDATNRSFRESITHLMNQFRSERNELSAARDRLNYGIGGGSKRISAMMVDVEAAGKHVQIRHETLQMYIKRQEDAARAFRDKQFRKFGEEASYSGHNLSSMVRDLRQAIKQSNVQTTYRKTTSFIRTVSDVMNEVMSLSTRIQFSGEGMSRITGSVQTQRRLEEASIMDESVLSASGFARSRVVNLSETQSKLSDVRERLRQLQEQRAAAQRTIAELT